MINEFTYNQSTPIFLSTQPLLSRYSILLFIGDIKFIIISSSQNIQFFQCMRIITKFEINPIHPFIHPPHCLENIRILDEKSEIKKPIILRHFDIHHFQGL